VLLDDVDALNGDFVLAGVGGQDFSGFTFVLTGPDNDGIAFLEADFE
jgi:hypothetical protein